MSIELDIEWGKVAGWVAGSLAALAAWAGKRQVARIDRHDERLDAIEKDVVKKDDLTQMETRITAHITQTGSHLTERIGDAKSTADAAHRRLDSVMQSGGSGNSS